MRSFGYAFFIEGEIIMDKDEIIMRKRNKIVHNIITEIKSVLADCSLSEMEKIDEIEYLIKTYREKEKLSH